MRALSRPIKFEEVDAAGIVFFARFANYAHEAMEDFFAAVGGGYPDLITRRRVGFPAVKLTAEFARPVRYGDTLRIETTVDRLGTRSLDFRYRMFVDAELAAELVHTVVVSDLTVMRSIDMPPDVRAVLEAHREA